MGTNGRLAALALTGVLAVLVGCASAPRSTARTASTPPHPTGIVKAPAPVAVAIQPQPPSEPIPGCPTDTWWDGIICAHAPATCGGWDGLSCAGPSPDTDRAAEREFAAIDAEARAICPDDDDARQVYSGNAVDIKDAVDAALGLAANIEQRLNRLGAAQATPRWTTLTEARAGSLYDCISTSLQRASPTYFTPKQQAALATLPPAAQAQFAAGAVARVKDAWRSMMRQYLAILAKRMVDGYVTAELLARRYAIGGGGVTRARQRLHVVASVLGEEMMGALVGGVVDPTDLGPDPDGRRHVRYVAGIFGAIP